LRARPRGGITRVLGSVATELSRLSPSRPTSQPLRHFFLICPDRPFDSVGVFFPSSVPGIVGALAQNSNRLPKLGVTHSVFHITIIPDDFRFGQASRAVTEDTEVEPLPASAPVRPHDRLLAPPHGGRAVQTHPIRSSVHGAVAAERPAVVAMHNATQWP
jgi:hypothetical protein